LANICQRYGQLQSGTFFLRHIVLHLDNNNSSVTDAADATTTRSDSRWSTQTWLDL